MTNEAADILLAQDGPLPVIAFHVQQALEKYLKGFLFYTGWSLGVHTLLDRKVVAADLETARAFVALVRHKTC